MKTQAQHTPTPWNYDGMNYIFSKDNEMIAEIRGYGAKLPMDVNAAFIVRAVNAHENLVQMLAHVESWLRDGFFDKTDDKCRSKADEIAHTLAHAAAEEEGI